ncbi:MAG: hypothetical protein KC549_18190 [Myxococcales bacterium]|nr:hypothetical protein [Myxococcales bacterium]MCB9550104.1 alpha/beta hydrolase [Myxococcales bacterium]
MTTPPTVLLLHGLARTSASLRKLESALQAAGHPTWNGGYPSTQADLPALAADVIARVRTEVGPGPVAAVTHSMGGILVRHIGARLPWTRIVMLAPPNGGSGVARSVKDWWLYRWIYGPAGQTVADGEAWPPPPAPCGVIAGTRGPSLDNPPSWLIQGLRLIPPGAESDGTVTVDETRGTPHVDFATVDAGHTRIMNHPETQRLVLRFLATGSFKEEAA